MKKCKLDAYKNEPCGLSQRAMRAIGIRNEEIRKLRTIVKSQAKEIIKLKDLLHIRQK